LNSLAGKNSGLGWGFSESPESRPEEDEGDDEKNREEPDYKFSHVPPHHGLISTMPPLRK